MDSPGELKRGAAARERILEASAELFGRKGYHGTALNEILAACGLSKGGFYHHFTSKEELFAATIERFLSTRAGSPAPSEACAERTREPQPARERESGDDRGPGAGSEAATGVSGKQSVEERLRLLFRSISERTADYHSLVFEAVRASDDVRDRIQSLYREHIERCRRLLVEGQKAGEVRASIDCSFWASHMVGSLEGASLLAALGGEPISDETIGRLFETMWRVVRRIDL